MPNYPPNSPAKGSVGRPYPHESAQLHVTGAATYTDDIREPAGCLHAYVLQSPYAHARIKRMDTKPCLMPGVYGVMTAQDLPASNEVAPVFDGDPIFAEEEVLYAGQSVLAVAAESIALARQAAQQAVIEYEELPTVLTPQQALAKSDFIGETYVMQQGDSERGLAHSQHRLEGTLAIGGQDHFYLEGQIALVTPGDDGEMHCWSSTQHPSEVQHLIAKTLGLADHAVTVEVRRMGGAFGGKESQASLIACIAAALAWQTNRPVKLRLDRDDDMKMTGKRHDFHVEYNVGFDETGLITGLDICHQLNCGMSADLSNAIADRAMFHTDNTYYLSDAKVTSYRCRTNKVSNTAFRGFGGPQGMLAIESIIDEIARYLGKDPLAIRKRNFYDPAEALGERSMTHYGMKVEDNIIHDLIAELEERADYATRVEPIRAFNAQNRILKKGIALTPVKFGISFTLKMLNQAGALVHIYKDGSVQLNHGGTEMGQGLHQKICQVVAEEFQIDLKQVRITATNTSKVPNTSATAASSGSDLNGKAAQAAARTIKERLVEFAAKHFSVAPDEVVFKEGWVQMRDRAKLAGRANRAIPFAELVQLAYANRISLSSTGFYATPKITWDRKAAKGRPFFYFAYGAAVSEVIIDTLTGEYNLLRTDIVHDVGKSLNPALDRGQIEGGFVQGMGWLTTEELWWDDKGILKTHAPSTYKIPTGRDIPNEFHVHLFNNENREDTIYRSKAVAEPPLMLGISVFLALRDAVAASANYKKIPKLNAPATPERILMAIEALKS